MKTLIYILLFAFTLIEVQAQEKKNEKISESSFEVPGVCEMCEARIEDAALRSKGVKTADWDQQTKLLSIIYRNDKTDQETIRKVVASIGHGYQLSGQDSIAYENLPNCCKYNDGIKDH